MTLSALLRGSLATTLATAALLAVTARTAQAQTAYALANSGSTLISFNVATPGSVTTIGTFSGASTQLDGMDFRVSNGLLYGYDVRANRLVTVDLTTAVTTLVATPTTASSSVLLGIDFNPMVDRLRLVNANDQNLRINPAGGATTVDGTFTYAAGDVNAGVNPNIIDAAYTNNVAGAGSTSLYYIDSAMATSALVTTTNPNGGVLNTVGSLGVTTNSGTSFDIYSSGGGVETAYAVLSSGTSPSLYTINLQTGAASLVGAVNATNVFGLAVQPGSAPAATAAAPEPGSIALLLTASVPAVGLVRRRKKSIGKTNH